MTFSLPAEAVNGAQKVMLLGDFNNWRPEEAIVLKAKNGAYTATVEYGTRQGIPVQVFDRQRHMGKRLGCRQICTGTVRRGKFCGDRFELNGQDCIHRTRQTGHIAEYAMCPVARHRTVVRMQQKTYPCKANSTPTLTPTRLLWP